MPLPQFDDLPFNSRPDLTPYIIHLTKNAGDETAFDNLISILQTGKIRGSRPDKGFIKGPHKAACFMDVPFGALKYVLTPENADLQHPRYEPYGIVLTKSWAYRKGCRPVLYLSNEESVALGIPTDELWRVVRFEASKKGWISWVHEREWRCKGSLDLPATIAAVLVKHTREAAALTKTIVNDAASFKCKPRSVIPLNVVSQGLLCD